MKKSRLLGAVLACLIFSIDASASYIVDTGPGDATAGGHSVTTSQWLAGQFTITDSYTLTSVEGWFYAPNDGTATAAIYSDNGTGVPVNELYHQQVLLDSPSSGVNAWDGAYGLDWGLASGTYWLAFELRTGDTFSGAMPSGTGTFGNGAPNPLDDYARWSDIWGWLEQSPSLALGMRISADPVPVPPAVWLFGSGLIGLIGVARRKAA